MPARDSDLPTAPAIELVGVRKSYGDFAAVRELHLAVPEGSIFGLLGPNGAGKTTTLRMIMNIIAPDAGSVRFFGRRRSPDDLRRIGYLPEERGLYPKMRVAELLLFLARLRGLSRREAVPRIDRWLEKVELAAWRDRKVEELSKGMQQKIQLVGTVLHEPEILVLDEPFSGLDPINQGLFKVLLAEYRASGRAILFSTHVMEQAEKLCDRICLVSRGRAVLEGSLPEIRQRYGGSSFRVEATGDLERAARLEGVEQATPHNGSLDLRLTAGADPSAVLRSMLEFLDVREFRSVNPDLEEIFLRAVREAE